MRTTLLKRETIIGVWQLIIKLRKLCLFETCIVTILIEVKQRDIHICAKNRELFIKLQKKGNRKGSHSTIPHLLVAHLRQLFLNLFWRGSTQGRRR